MLKYLDEYRDAEICLSIAGEIRDKSTKPFNIMEVCGGHTMAIRKNGIHKLLGSNIKMISGPGCPVCVTSMRDIDYAIELAMQNNAVICTFGDMFYVPGTNSSLAEMKAEGKDIRIVYSVHDALEYAAGEPEKDFIFISIGFETTTPTIAACILQAARENIKNFKVLALNKTMPKALEAVLGSEDSRIDALICPGHVSAITGTSIYEFIVEKLKVSCCVSGFEPVDILRAVKVLTELNEKESIELVNTYERAVLPEGNIKAKEIMYEVFEETDADWRGVGIIPGSGLGLRDKYKEYDAGIVYEINIPEDSGTTACICGDVLRGAKDPVDCSMFRKECSPMNPKGACMVSSEGACAAWYKYGENA